MVVSKSIYSVLALVSLFTFSPVGAGPAAKFLGANSCASSSCHGGGGANQNQFLVWSLQDFHSQRPVATLASARSKQIAEALQITDPAAAARCIACHAPLAGVPEDARGDNFQVRDGVSCECCHGPAQNWLRAHTRTDYTRADRTAAGMRDLLNLYVRANVCVACHQNVDPDLLLAGHPELIFELDGQSVAEPKHWRAASNGYGAQAWLVGQAVALREMSWQTARQKSPTESQRQRLLALAWLVAKAQSAASNLPAGPVVGSPASPADYSALQSWGDQTAQAAAGMEWSPALTRKLLDRFAQAGADFVAADNPAPARRAERLVLALDRLVAALPELRQNLRAQSALDQCFKLAQSIPDFDPKSFAAALEDFSAALAAQ
jgi:hypothetical protein